MTFGQPRKSASWSARIAVAASAAACIIGAGSGPSLATGDPLPPGVPYASNTDPVRIVSVSYKPEWIERGGTVTARVVCTSNAAAVTGQVGTVRVLFPKKAHGIFVATLHVPALPFYPAHQDVVITAIRTDGATVQRTISVDVH